MPANDTNTPTTSAPDERGVSYSDNRLLIDLCGPYDQHLAMIERALELTDGNRTEAARHLGISRRTMQRKLKEMGAIGDGEDG